MTKKDIMSRRHFLKGAMVLSGASVLAGGVGPSFANLNALSRNLSFGNLSGYKSLVCIYLAGGNDSVNMIIPRSDSGYATYADVRQDLAVDRDSLLSIDTTSSQDDQFGLHPKLPNLHQLFNQKKLSFISNVGSLVEPTSYDDYMNRRIELPPHLFSHNDQTKQWLRGSLPASQLQGWAGRIADGLQTNANPNGVLPMNISTSSSNAWQIGRETLPYVLARTGAQEYKAFKGASKANQARRATYQKLLEASQDNVFLSEYQGIQKTSLNLSTEVADVLNALPELQTVFPDTKLGDQLKTIARMLKARDSFSMNRQCFFARKNGFDTHANQNEEQAELYEDLDQCLAAFQNALIELGIEDDVVTFTASDFGRSVGTNGDGTDHGWGGHHVIMGTSVKGGEIIGRMPDLSLDGTDTINRGRLLPQFSVDQYAATLAQWYGLDAQGALSVFPHLSNFQTHNLALFS
ncbi:MAG: DUF1501 domain-containing protein [Pseudomonadota bacterium]